MQLIMVAKLFSQKVMKQMNVSRCIHDFMVIIVHVTTSSESTTVEPLLADNFCRQTLPLSRHAVVSDDPSHIQTLVYTSNFS